MPRRLVDRRGEAGVVLVAQNGYPVVLPEQAHGMFRTAIVGRVVDHDHRRCVVLGQHRADAADQHVAGIEIDDDGDHAGLAARAGHSRQRPPSKRRHQESRACPGEAVFTAARNCASSRSLAARISPAAMFLRISWW